MFTNDDALPELLKSIRMHGQGSDRYEHVRIGVNSRLDEMQAALLRVKLPRLDAWNERRARLAARYPQLVAKDAEFAVKMILDAMTHALVHGQRIEIRGFGSFGLNYRPPRVGRNPKSGDRVQVPAKHVPHFKPGKDLRDKVNEQA